MSGRSTGGAPLSRRARCRCLGGDRWLGSRGVHLLRATHRRQCEEEAGQRDRECDRSEVSAPMISELLTDAVHLVCIGAASYQF